MDIPRLNGWQLTTNENGVEMATLPAEQLREVVQFLEYISKKAEFIYCEENDYNEGNKCKHQCIPCVNWEEYKSKL